MRGRVAVAALMLLVAALLAAFLFFPEPSALGEDGQRSLRKADEPPTITLKLPGKPEDYVRRLSALFEMTDKNCPSTTGLFFIAEKGVRLIIPSDRIESQIGVRPDLASRSVTFELTTVDCKYEIVISRSDKKDGQWVKANLLKPPTAQDTQR